MIMSFIMRIARTLCAPHGLPASPPLQLASVPEWRSSEAFPSILPLCRKRPYVKLQSQRLSRFDKLLSPAPPGTDLRSRQASRPPHRQPQDPGAVAPETASSARLSSIHNAGAITPTPTKSWNLPIHLCSTSPAPAERNPRAHNDDRWRLRRARLRRLLR
jgi:hypothetical protein